MQCHYGHLANLLDILEFKNEVSILFSSIFFTLLSVPSFAFFPQFKLNIYSQATNVKRFLHSLLNLSIPFLLSLTELPAGSRICAP